MCRILTCFSVLYFGALLEVSENWRPHNLWKKINEWEAYLQLYCMLK